MLPLDVAEECESALAADAANLKLADVRVTPGDLRCLLAGHVARVAIRSLARAWDAGSPLADRMMAAEACIGGIARLVAQRGLLAEATVARRPAAERVAALS